MQPAPIPHPPIASILSKMRIIVLLLFLLPLVAAEVLIGSLSELAHNVSGTVHAVTTRTIEIRSFYYDGLGPETIFQVDTGPTATSSGTQALIFPSCTLLPDLPAAADTTYTLALPPGTTLADWQFFSVWCSTASELFGGISLSGVTGVPDSPPVCVTPSPSPPPADTKVLIGDLSMLAHDVSGTVYALNNRVLRIENFNYDGSGPAAVFWTGTGSVNGGGQRVPFRTTCLASEKLPAYAGETIELELPNGLTLSDVDYLSVWCESATSDFGSVSIDAASLSGVVDAAALCSETEDEEGPFPVPEGFNCQEMSDDFQVRWRLGEEDVEFELVGRIGTAQYMGFGVSGEADRTEMNAR